jgi:hypothetical protein
MNDRRLFGLRGKDGEKEPFEDKRVSHGICQKCLIRIYGPEFAQPENENSQFRLPLKEAPVKELH